MLGGCCSWVCGCFGAWMGTVGSLGAMGTLGTLGMVGKGLHALPLDAVSSSAPKSHAREAFWGGSPTPRRLWGGDTVCPVMAESTGAPQSMPGTPQPFRAPPSWVITWSEGLRGGFFGSGVPGVGRGN